MMYDHQPISLSSAPGSRGEKSNLNDFFLRFNSPGASKTRALPNLEGGVTPSQTFSNVGNKKQGPDRLRYLAVLLG